MLRTFITDNRVVLGKGHGGPLNHASGPGYMVFIGYSIAGNRVGYFSW